MSESARTQSNQDTSLSSWNMSSQPTSMSGTLRTWETRTQKCRKCMRPPTSHADVLGEGRGTLFGKMEISKAMRLGMDVSLACAARRQPCARGMRDVAR